MCKGENELKTFDCHSDQEQVIKARASLNQHAADIAVLLKRLVSECRCGGPARVKVSVGGAWT